MSVTQLAIISMSGATYPSDTWRATLHYFDSLGVSQEYVVDAGSFSVDGSNILNAANAFTNALNSQLPSEFTVTNLTSSSLRVLRKLRFRVLIRSLSRPM